MQVRHALMTLLTMALRQRDGTRARHAGFVKRPIFRELSRHPQSELWHLEHAAAGKMRPDVEAVSDGRAVSDPISVAAA